MTNELKYWYEDEGFCRVVFKRIVEHQAYIYCWQLNGDKHYTFYRCSADAEPDHEVIGFGGVSAWYLTPDNPGQTSTGRELNEFLARQKAGTT